MSTIQALRVAHILAALWFSGGMIAFALLHLRLLSGRTLPELIFSLRFSLFLSRTAIVPGGLLAASFGVALALVEGYNILETPWLLFSVLLFLYATVVGITYLTPGDKQALRLAEEEYKKGLAGDQSQRFVHRAPAVVLRLLNLLVVLLLILLMIVRPHI